jgi:hypothetical protein
LSSVKSSLGGSIWQLNQLWGMRIRAWLSVIESCIIGRFLGELRKKNQSVSLGRWLRMRLRSIVDWKIKLVIKLKVW